MYILLVLSIRCCFSLCLHFAFASPRSFTSLLLLLFPSLRCCFSSCLHFAVASPRAFTSRLLHLVPSLRGCFTSCLHFAVSSLSFLKKSSKKKKLLYVRFDMLM